MYANRLRCCVCGADLGPADDPYRDPDCLDCLRREWEKEEAEEAYYCADPTSTDEWGCPFPPDGEWPF